jgi:hypothetical protein
MGTVSWASRNGSPLSEDDGTRAWTGGLAQPVSQTARRLTCAASTVAGRGALSAVMVASHHLLRQSLT